MDWKHYVLALPIALFLLFLAFSFAGDTSQVIAKDEPVAVDGYVLGQDCDDDSSDEDGDKDGDSSEEEGDEDSESEDDDGDEDSSDEDCPEEEEGEDDED